MRKSRNIILILVLLLFFKGIFFQNRHEQLEFDTDWDKWALGLKTGKETFKQRVQAQIWTFLSGVRNLEIFGDGDAYLGQYHMIDIVKDSTFSKVRKGSQKSHNVVKNEEIQPDKGSIGWIMDAHKNLPAFDYLYKKYHNAEWFILIDDDTYLFKHNLKIFLDQFNSSESHYFGAPFNFVNCDGVRKLGDGPRFAQGGAGIVISHGAMKKMSNIMLRCIAKYRDCSAGDVRTALCLRDAGMLLSPNYLFSAYPPHLSNFHGPCSLPISYHHLLTTHFEKLYMLDGKQVTMGDVFTLFMNDQNRSISMGQLIENSDRRGLDYKSIKNIFSEQKCYDICLEDKKCMSFTYLDTICYLKQGIPRPVSKKGAYTAAFPHKFICESLPDH